MESPHPVPYQRCYCSICRKAGGGGGYSINISADARTLEVAGGEHVREYRAMIERGGERRRSRHRRCFCGHCGCHLWAINEQWPDLLHPVAGAIDTPLPDPPQWVHMMLGSKAAWVSVDAHDGDDSFDAYPKETIAGWHDSRGLTR